MITWGSERSGIASSGTLRTATSEPTTANAVKTNTSTRWAAQYSMILPTMGPSSVPVTGVGLLAHAGNGRLQAALRVDQERSTRHHRVAFGHPLQDLHAIAVLRAGPYHPRLEVPRAPGHEHILVLAGVHHRLARERERRARAPGGPHPPEHAGLERAVGVGERKPHLERARLARHRGIDELDTGRELPT